MNQNKKKKKKKKKINILKPKIHFYSLHFFTDQNRAEIVLLTNKVTLKKGNGFNFLNLPWREREKKKRNKQKFKFTCYIQVVKFKIYNEVKIFLSTFYSLEKKNYQASSYFIIRIVWTILYFKSEIWYNKKNAVSIHKHNYFFFQTSFCSLVPIYCFLFFFFFFFFFNFF